MAAPAVEPQQPVAAHIVGFAFVKQYYLILHQSPGLVHQFYQDASKIGRPEEDGTMSITTTMDEINTKILSNNYDEYTAEIKSVDSQESINGGVTVLVTGYLTGKDNIVRNFTQSFFLAPQDKGYYVLNDILRYMENTDNTQETHTPPADVEDPITPEQVVEVSPEQENHVSEKETILIEESQEEAVSPQVNEVTVVKEEEPVSEVINEVKESSQPITESATKAEEVQKKSYASIVMALKQNNVPFSSPVHMQRKPQLKKQEQQLNNIPPTKAASHTEPVENGIHEEEADGCSIYIKGLPMIATPALLEEEFKKFGPIKHGGIQVRSNRGFCFGFVQFELPEAVQKAIEASPITIGGRNVVVEEKRSTNSKGNQGRFPVGRANGFRDNVRGRGNYGSGRGYNRGGDFGGRNNDYNNNNNNNNNNNRGNNNGGRMNRGAPVNGTTKNMATRVSATA